MKRNVKVLLGIFCLVGGWQVSRISHASQALKAVTFIALDELLAQDEQQRMVHALMQEHTVSPVPSVCTLRQRYPEVDASYVRRLRPQTYHITITCPRPLIRLNNDLLLSSRCDALPAHLYDGDVVQRLQVLEHTPLKQYTAVSPDVVSFVGHMPDELWHHFTVCWQAPTTVVLSDKEHPYLSLLCDATHIPDTAVINDCHEIYQQFDQTALRVKKQQVVADVRFERQIVAYVKSQGGI